MRHSSPPKGSDLAIHWGLQPDLAFLNHGSFGACPLQVLAAQAQLRDRIERQPVQFFGRDLPELAGASRRTLASFVGAEADDLAFVPNATTGVNTALRSFPLERGDEVLATDQTYAACRNALDVVAKAKGASVRIAPLAFPIRSEADAIESIMRAVRPNTRLALIDHIMSPTALVLPIAAIVEALKSRGVETIVDGAHAPGQIDLDVSAVGAAYYTGNCHKWLCTPKGSAFLHVRGDLQSITRPLVISHGASAQGSGRFRREADWTGTHDPTPWLVIPDALRFFDEILPGGIHEARMRNRALALRARAVIFERLGIETPAPDSMVGSMAAFVIPDSRGERPESALDPMTTELVERFGIEVNVSAWPSWPSRLMRISAQLYNRVEQFEYLAEVLADPRLGLLIGEAVRPR